MNNSDLLAQFGATVPFIRNTELRAIRLDQGGIEVLMPFTPNINHVGVMYAGALFTLAESMGGAVCHVYLQKEGIFPIVKGLNIKFTRPARTDISCTYKMDPTAAKKILDECEKNGKANYDIQVELKDAQGEVVARAEGFYQIRKGTTF
jgi:thioesterase domain-containing protein